ncbi:hypothetical protein ABGB18_31985 [Nonomuraea sp. B12E4]|uniref:hypothetical protein n=1 Tax=Nonomuraea sp. B12E4 TaxID=3153564 RepID=UPI00325E600A
MNLTGNTVLTLLFDGELPQPPDPAHVMTALIELPPGEPMLTYVDDEELAARRDRRAPRPN